MTPGQSFDAAADSAVIAWQYAGGSASGSVPIQVPNTTAAGAYELRLFSNNSYTKLATSNGFSVDPPPPATLSATGSASPGGSVTANWAGILAPTAADWIGLFVPGAADSAVLSWHYTTGVAAGNVPVSLPANLAQGTYELRLFAKPVLPLSVTMQNTGNIRRPMSPSDSSSSRNLQRTSEMNYCFNSVLASAVPQSISLKVRRRLRNEVTISKYSSPLTFTI